LEHLVRALGLPRIPRPGGSDVRLLGIGVLATAFEYTAMHALVSEHVLSPAAATGLVHLASAVIAAVMVGGTSVERLRALFTERSAFLAVSSAFLNGAGVAVAAVLAANIDYRVSWLVVRAVVLTAWTVPLLRAGGALSAASPVRVPASLATLQERRLARARAVSTAGEGGLRRPALGAEHRRA
jgi:hypothetical protein